MPPPPTASGPAATPTTTTAHASGSGPRRRLAGTRSPKRRSAPYDAPSTNVSVVAPEAIVTQATAPSGHRGRPSGRRRVTGDQRQQRQCQRGRAQDPQRGQAERMGDQRRHQPARPAERDEGAGDPADRPAPTVQQGAHGGSRHERQQQPHDPHRPRPEVAAGPARAGHDRCAGAAATPRRAGAATAAASRTVCIAGSVADGHGDRPVGLMSEMETSRAVFPGWWSVIPSV